VALDWTKLLIAYAWPLTALTALAALRGPLDRLLRVFAKAIAKGRGLKVSVADVNIELLGASTEKESKVAAVSDLPFAAEPAMFASSGREYIESLIEGAQVEATTVDLRAANSDGFLTSRLFLTAKLMARQRGTKVVAFVHTAGVREAVYLGACLVDDLNRALAGKFPEYEAAFARAIHAGWWIQHNPGAVVGPGGWPSPPNTEPLLPRLGPVGRLLPDDAARVVGEFLEALQFRSPNLVAAAPPSPHWVWLPRSFVYERADWVTAEWLKEALGGAFMTSRVTQGRGAADKVLAFREAYVGLVDSADHLLELVSRARLLEQLVPQQSDDSQRESTPRTTEA
jgi:hypothetical protein